MVRYPDILTITIDPELVQNEDSGTFEPIVGEPESFTSECRATPAENNPTITGSDGSSLVYQFVISMPVTSSIFKFGAKVNLVTSSGEFSAKVIRQQNGYNNTVLWL